MLNTSNLPTGIRVKGNSIQLDFYYNKSRYRKNLDLLPTNKNINFATRLRDKMQFEMECNDFDYSKYFSNVNKNNNNQKEKCLISSLNCRELLFNQQQLYERKYTYGKLAASTLKSYKQNIKYHLLPNFGDLKLTEISGLLIRKWIFTLNKSEKTINNILIPLKHMLANAIKDELIKDNPFEKAFLKDALKDIAFPERESVDPFSFIEKTKIINTATGQLKNLFKFAFWSGLRTGELIALRWSDIDFKNKLINVTKNIVCGHQKGPKTKSGIRSVLILPEAEVSLQEQFKYTGIKNDFVFHNPNTNKAWSNDGKIRLAWIKVLKESTVRYRYPYQTRHTYASTLLSNGETPIWIAKQMGHVDVETVFRVYGKWIPQDGVTGGYKLKGKY